MPNIGAPAFDHAAETALAISQKVSQAEFDQKFGAAEGPAVGDIKKSYAPLAEPEWLLCDATPRLRSSNPTLAAEIGVNIPSDRATVPDVLPNGPVYNATMSRDGVWVAATVNNSPYLYIYKRTGDNLVRMSTPYYGSLSESYGLAFSSDATYLVATPQTTDIWFYKRTGDTFTQITGPTYVPGNAGFSASFSPDDTHVVVGYSVSPFMYIYKRTGDTLTRLADPVSTLAGTPRALKYSPDGVYLAASHSISPFLSIYKRTGDTYAKLANPAVIPPSAGYSCLFSPDGVYLAVTFQTAPFLYLYKRSGDTFTKVSEPDVQFQATSTENSLMFTTDSKKLCVCGFDPYFAVYDLEGDKLTRIPSEVFPPGFTYSSVLSTDGKYMMQSHGATPFITLNIGITNDQFATPKIPDVNGMKSYIKA